MAPSAETVTRHSIIVPTFGRSDLLRRCLEALTESSPPTWAWEVLVVDNGRAADAGAHADVVESFQDPRLRYIRMDPLGLTAARHVGVEEARGDIISFVDDDSFVRPTWLVGMQEAFADESVVLVGGPNEPLFETPPPEWLKYFWVPAEGLRYLGYLSLLEGGSESRDMRPTLVFGCNATVRKKTFLAAGGAHPDTFPPGLRRFQGDGDTALMVRVEALGHRALFSPRCAIHHFVPSSRMTPEYFHDRGFGFGVEESFTSTRAEHGLGPREGVRPSAVPAPQRETPSLCQRVSGYLSHFRRRPVPPPESPESSAVPEPDAVSQLREEIARRRDAGWAFHRREVAADPSLLEFVIRTDYLEPDAWDAVRRYSAARDDAESSS